MAIIKAVNSKASISKAINYVTKKEKTEEKLISGKDCNPNTAIDEMKATKELWSKTEGRQYKHYVQSFNPEDNITPELAHNIGKKFIEENEKFKGHEVLISTHLDKGHIHNHFIVNSVNFENGKKYQEKKQDLEIMKEKSNQLSRENGLTIPTRGDKITTFNQGKYRAIEKGFKGEEKSYLLETAKEVSNTLKVATTRQEFARDMEKKGYQVNWSDNRKNITFTTPGGQKVRNSNLEKTFKQEKFSKEGMEHELQRNREKTRERGTTRRLDERDNGVKQANAELHKGADERGLNKENHDRPRTKQNIKDKSGNPGENAFDFDRARKHAEGLRKQTVSDYGNWKKGNENEQSDDFGKNGSDRELSENSLGRNGRGSEKEIQITRERDFGPSR